MLLTVGFAVDLIINMKSAYRFNPRKIKSSPTGKIFYVMFASRPGKWISSGQNNKIDAIIWADKNRYNSNLFKKKKNYTFKQFAEGFFSDDSHGWRKRQDKKNKVYSDAYYKSHQGRIDNYITPFFGDFIISAITPRIVDDWLLDICSETTNKELSDNSKNKILYCLRIVLGEATDQGLIQENPAQKVTPITERHKSRGIFTKDEINTLFDQDDFTLLMIWQTYSWYLFFKIQAVCGLRPGEVAALCWSDLHEDLSGFVVSKSVDYSTGKIKGLKTEKSGMKDKVSLLDIKTLDDLQKFRNSLKEISPLELLFKSDRNNTIKPETSLKHFKASCNRAQIKLGDRTQYSLRHIFDTDLLKELPRDVVNDLMGHTSYRADYDHRTPVDRLEQLQHVRNLLNEKWG